MKPGRQLFDRIKVTGLGKTPATVEVELFGPFASRAAIAATGDAVLERERRRHRRRRVPLAAR